MQYESRDQNAMILPVSVRQPATEESLRFIDLREYDTFFADLDNGFPYSAPAFSIGCSAPVAIDAAAALEVFEVGNYIASFVPSLAAFSRLDQRFRLPATAWSEVPQYKRFGFAVFQLAAGALEPHPMAFEFDTAHESLFFPTLHIHDGQVHGNEEFGHVLYLQHAGFDSRVYGYANADVPDRSTGLVRSKRLARHFCSTERSKGIVEPDLLVHRQSIRGKHPNRDTEFVAFGDPITPTFNYRPWLAYLPWLAIAFLIAWFMSRRAKIRSLRAAGSQQTVTTEKSDEPTSR